MAYRGKDLAGTCGIPRHEERTYVEAELCGRRGGQIVRPIRFTWTDGRSWRVEFARPVAKNGREAFGNLVTRWEVTIGHSTKVLWLDGGGWFVKARER